MGFSTVIADGNKKSRIFLGNAAKGTSFEFLNFHFYCRNFSKLLLLKYKWSFLTYILSYSQRNSLK